jgi:hypothetical protein
MFAMHMCMANEEHGSELPLPRLAEEKIPEHFGNEWFSRSREVYPSDIFKADFFKFFEKFFLNTS